VPAMTREEYDARIDQINEEIRDQHPEQVDIVSTGQGAISDDDFVSHVAFIDQVQADYIDGEGLAYGKAFKDNFGLWSEEWQQIFDALVDEVYDDLTDNQTKPRDYRAIILGGLPGAGKSSTLDALGQAEVFRSDEWITANPDNFKDRMIERGLFPQVEGLTPAETASFIHEASSEMNHMLEQLLTVEGYNVIFDITLGGRQRAGEDDWNQMLINRLDSLGYSTDGIFVDVPPSTSRQRVTKRHKEGLDAYRTGRAKRANSIEIKIGGRVVPDDVISKNTMADDDPDKEKYNSVNARNFDRLKDSFVRWAAYENSGTAPKFTDGTASDEGDLDNLPGVYPPSTPGVAA
jgi:predicted kinase